MVDERAVLYATRTDISEIRNEVRENFHLLNGSINKLVDQIQSNACLQERVVIAWENTNKKFEETGCKIESLTNKMEKIEIERIQYKAKWDMLFGFRSVWMAALKLPIIIILISLISEGTTDFFHATKLAISHLIGL